MVSGEKKRAALRDKLQTLRSITNSRALDETAIVIDASQYIRELKHMVERLSQDVSVAESSSGQPRLPVVNVETLEKGLVILIHVFYDNSCPGLLVLTLEAFEELGLDVTEARVCCSDSFQLQAFGGENLNDGEAIDLRVIEKAVVRAVKNWAESK